jgi:hypothetical protein
MKQMSRIQEIRFELFSILSSPHSFQMDALVFNGEFEYASIHVSLYPMEAFQFRRIAPSI